MEIAAAISKAEHYLSQGAVIPFLGSVPAALKVGMGGLQTISGLAIAILFVIPACCNEKAREIFKQGLVHVVHGGGNILVGILEAIPIVGTVVAVVGLRKSEQYRSEEPSVNPGFMIPSGIASPPMRARLVIDIHCGKFLAYRSLVKEHGIISVERKKPTDPDFEPLATYSYDNAKKVPIHVIPTYWLAV